MPNAPMSGDDVRSTEASAPLAGWASLHLSHSLGSFLHFFNHRSIRNGDASVEYEISVLVYFPQRLVEGTIDSFVLLQGINHLANRTRHVLTLATWDIKVSFFEIGANRALQRQEFGEEFRSRPSGRGNACFQLYLDRLSRRFLELARVDYRYYEG